jgi:hypothetical protein
MGTIGPEPRADSLVDHVAQHYRGHQPVWILVTGVTVRPHRSEIVTPAYDRPRRALTAPACYRPRYLNIQRLNYL